MVIPYKIVLYGQLVFICQTPWDVQIWVYNEYFLYHKYH